MLREFLLIKHPCTLRPVSALISSTSCDFRLSICTRRCRQKHTRCGCCTALTVPSHTKKSSHALGGSRREVNLNHAVPSGLHDPNPSLVELCLAPVGSFGKILSEALLHVSFVSLLLHFCYSSSFFAKHINILASSGSPSVSCYLRKGRSPRWQNVSFPGS